MAIHQVFTLQVGIVRQAQLPQRQLEVRFLGVMRIDADGDQDEVAQIGRSLAEVEDVVVPRGVGLEAQMGLQRRVLAADLIEPGDLGVDVARRLVVAWAQLVLLRIEVLLLAWYRLGLA